MCNVERSRNLRCKSSQVIVIRRDFFANWPFFCIDETHYIKFLKKNDKEYYYFPEKIPWSSKIGNFVRKAYSRNVIAVIFMLVHVRLPKSKAAKFGEYNVHNTLTI